MDAQPASLPRIARDLPALRSALAGLPRPVALVPTMGALHEGHCQLIRAARAEAASVIASVFVNPIQFGPNEDLDAYPRDEAGDLGTLAEAGCDLAWLPSAAVMYPQGDQTRVRPGPLAEVMDGAARLGHFEGVCTVVAKLFGQVRPDAALFGEKDYQQLRVIERMTRDLSLGPRIVGVPTVREPDGLAMSSRNRYLSAEERRRAAAMPQTLDDAAARLRGGERAAGVLADAVRALERAGFALGYLDLRRGDDLAPLPPGPASAADLLHARLFVAARLGTTRLIDNVAVRSGVTSA